MDILEQYRILIADDFDFEYATVKKAMSMMFSVIIEHKPGRIARQKVVNEYARIIRENPEKAEEMILAVLNDMEGVEKFLADCKTARFHRSMDRSMKQMSKLISELSAMAQ